MTQLQGKIPLRIYWFSGIAGLLLYTAAFLLLDIWAIPTHGILQALAALLIIAGGSATAYLYQSGGTYPRDTEYGTVFSWVILAGMGIAILLFPMQTFFYGDGGLLIPQIHTLAKGEPFQRDLLLNMKSSPLSGFVLIQTALHAPGILSSLGASLPETALYPFQWISVFCFLLLAAGLLYFPEKKQRLHYALFIFGTAGTLFYFGYVEFYTLSYTLTILYFLSAERALRMQRGLWIPIVLFFLSMLAHYETAALLPSLLYLLFEQTGSGRPFTLRNIFTGYGILLVVGIVLYVVSGLASSDNRIVMPLFPVSNPSGTHSYTLLSAAHLRDIVNILLLLAPVQLLGIAILALHPKRKTLFGTPVTRFYIIAALFFFTFVFFGNTSLGLARDWDITAPLGIIFSLGALSLVHHPLFSQSSHRISIPIQMGCIALLLAANWCTENIKPQHSAERFEHLLALDSGIIYPDYAHSGFEALRKYYRRENNIEKDLALTKKKIELLDYPEDYSYLYGRSLASMHTDPAAFLAMQRWMLEHLAQKAKELQERRLRKDYSISMKQIDSLTQIIAANAYTQNILEKLQPDVDRIARITGTAQPYSLVSALRMYQAKQYPEATALFMESIQAGLHSPLIYRLLGTALSFQGRGSDALATIRKGISDYPEDALLWLTLGDWLVRANIRPDEAQHALETASGLTQDQKLLTQIRGIQQKLAQQQQHSAFQ